ncbi:hypothetical protein KOI35_42630 [Actinoplanes bogorensis]|uniref:DUF2634 domain-containing protein n=1 Tax=Paractinoplanes bogorensis TaxID=1610840 RepID=A0ABS5Z5K7_9ACTN|nr:hypothetical protein [Actinoplanes bogorensis]MBU2670218.1 hypothetical protein [Actinoplanes bogorensis]
MLGHSLELRDGDLVMAGGRMATVAGLANAVQALTLRVLTPLGTDRFAVTYGLDLVPVLTQAVGARTAQDLLRLSLVRTLGSDPRVREIQDVTVSPDPGKRLWRVEVVLIVVDGTARELTFEVGA